MFNLEEMNCPSCGATGRGRLVPAPGQGGGYDYKVLCMVCHKTTSALEIQKRALGGKVKTPRELVEAAVERLEGVVPAAGPSDYLIRTALAAAAGDSMSERSLEILRDMVPEGPTRRERIATAVLAGFAMRADVHPGPDGAGGPAFWAIHWADAMIAVLDKARP
jgi:hypothetical protein